jgi:hypothetical protein
VKEMRLLGGRLKNKNKASKMSKKQIKEQINQMKTELYLTCSDIPLYKNKLLVDSIKDFEQYPGVYMFTLDNKPTYIGMCSSKIKNRKKQHLKNIETIYNEKSMLIRTINENKGKKLDFFVLFNVIPYENIKKEKLKSLLYCLEAFSTIKLGSTNTYEDNYKNLRMDTKGFVIVDHYNLFPYYMSNVISLNKDKSIFEQGFRKFVHKVKQKHII